MSELLKEQEEFVAWLKEKGLYNPMESGHVMQKMHEVWEACQEKEVLDDPNPSEDEPPVFSQVPIEKY